MVFSHILTHLIHWCDEQFMTYAEKAGNGVGLYYVGYQYACELRFKLATLVDREFDSLDAFRKEVIALLDIHYERAILNPPNQTAVAMIRSLRERFLEYFNSMAAEQGAVPLSEHPYIRVIVGEEGQNLIQRFRDIWGYDAGSYWHPLLGPAPELTFEMLFLMASYIEPYMEQIRQWMGLPYAHIYEYGEWYHAYPPHCLETVELGDCSGCESIYTDKDFTWAVYFSHENTVTFAGAIVPFAKELLAKEREHWNRFEWSPDPQ